MKEMNVIQKQLQKKKMKSGERYVSLLEQDMHLLNGIHRKTEKEQK
jgi:hypothetical protein